MKKKLNFIEEKAFEVEWTSKIPAHMVLDEDILRPEYEPQHPLEIEVRKFIKDKEDVQKGYIIMGLCEEDLRAMELREHETTYHNCYNFFNISIVKMKRDVFETLKSGLKRYIEFTEKELHDGVNYAGEIRQYSKDYIASIPSGGTQEFSPLQSNSNNSLLKSLICCVHSHQPQLSVQGRPISIFLHHELAQTPDPPDHICFYCSINDAEGGSTPLIRSDFVLPIGENRQFEAGIRVESEDDITDYKVFDNVSGVFVEDLNQSNLFQYVSL